jgi:hypothetical protein
MVSLKWQEGQERDEKCATARSTQGLEDSSLAGASHLFLREKHVQLTGLLEPA